MDYSNFLRPAFLTNTASELLKQPLTALLTVSEEAAKVLSNIGINSIFDLGSSQLFSAARQIKEATKIKDTEFMQRFSGDLIDASAKGKKNAEIADSPISVLRQLDDANATFIQNALSVTTIRELAAWPAYNIARAIINEAYGLSDAVIINDEERPDELIPIMRKYATERVQYDIIVMDKVLEKEKFAPQVFKYMTIDKIKKSIKALDLSQEESKELEKFIKLLPELKHELLLDGAIDISDIVGAALTARPAIGAVLTYRQSWYPQGLALGHLLHSMALAPGESTRIAMVDWTRTDRGNLIEQTSQAENLAADVNHTRSIGEVTSAVAKEAQKGFSKSESEATQEQNATTSGQSNLSSNLGAGISLSGNTANDKDGGNKSGELNLTGNTQFNLGVSSTGTSNANSHNHGWASSNSITDGERTLNATMQQNINDKTQQASNSVRNRRATTVKETSQKESETLSTRVVTNYNHMHALTIQYFEVVQIYKVLLELSKVTPCLFLPMKLVTFTEEVIRRYKNVIASAGLIPEVRGLAFAEPDKLSIRMPNKAGNWEGSPTLKKLLGYDINNSKSRNIELPLVGMIFAYVGSTDSKFNDNYESISITDKNGRISNYPIWTDTSLEGVVDFGRIGHGISLSNRFQNTKGGVILNGDYNGNYQDYTKISFIKKDKSIDFDDNFNATITLQSLNRQFSDGGPESLLVISGDIKPEKGKMETIIFNFQPTTTYENLISHLEENALHYSTAIWNSLDAATITTMLSSYTLMGKKLIENIDPVPVSIAGNYIIFRYYGVAQTEWKTFLNDKGLFQPAPIEDIIPLPSAGVFAEAVLGRSNAAEKLDITRFWNWQDSPIPILPPEIAALNAGGKNTPIDMQTGKLESPLINIINPPSLPDPTGLAPLYSAIANGNMFRDMSGMAQTSSLLQSAMQAAQSAAANAASTSGEAQKVAANQLTDILKIAAQIAAGAMGVPTGAIGGGGGNNGNSNTYNLPPTPSNKGANINAAKELDEKKRAATKQNNGNNNTTDEWTPFPDQTNNPNSGLTPPPLVDTGAFLNETAALNGLPESGIGGFFGNALTQAVLGGTPHSAYSKSRIQLVKKIVNTDSSKFGSCSQKYIQTMRDRIENFDLLGSGVAGGLLICWIPKDIEESIMKLKETIKGSFSEDVDHALNLIFGLPDQLRLLLKNDATYAYLDHSSQCAMTSEEKQYWENLITLLT
jgi:hypothetical protein